MHNFMCIISSILTPFLKILRSSVLCIQISPASNIAYAIIAMNWSQIQMVVTFLSLQGAVGAQMGAPGPAG
jgi:hypothetical protein